MIKIIDYKAGNVPSVLSAVLHLGYNAALSEKVLFLGVCVGMQILFEHSEEENATWVRPIREC